MQTPELYCNKMFSSNNLPAQCAMIVYNFFIKYHTLKITMSDFERELHSTSFIMLTRMESNQDCAQ